MIESVLKNLGLGEKAIEVYLSCLRLGPSPVRRIAQQANINRGTTYDILKSLQNLGLVSYYHKDKHQYFMAEDPVRLKEVVSQRSQQLAQTQKEIESIIPQLKSIYDKSGDKPVVKFYEGLTGIKIVLQDVLGRGHTGDSQYYVYSSSSIKKHLYQAYPGFSAQRIKLGIKVKTISIGPGGETVGLDQRKWLTQKESSPTYTLIYSGKVALVSVDAEGKPMGVIIEDRNIYQTQKMIFDFIWQQL